MEIQLKLLNEQLSIVKLSENTDPKKVFDKSQFASLTKTADELSLVIESQNVEEGWLENSGWRALGIVGKLDFSLVGVLSQLLSPLAQGGVSVFTISTFDTDYILIKEAQLKKALEILALSDQVTIV